MSKVTSKLILFLLGGVLLFSQNAFAQGSVSISFTFDNCAAPPQAGTYSPSGTKNGKPRYVKDGTHYAEWTGSRWNLVSDGTITHYNTTNSGKIPCSDWTASFGCFLPSITGDCTPPNSTPTKVGSIPDVSVSENAPNTTINLENYFDDAEDGASGLTYTNQTSDPSYFSTSIDGSNQLIIDYATSGTGGPTTVTIRGTDTNGAYVEQSFSVTVNSPGVGGTLVSESFTDATGGATTFQDAGTCHSFNLTGTYDIEEFAGYGHGGDDRYIGNANNCPSGSGVLGSIVSTAGDFYVRSLWVFPSEDCSDLGTNGSATIYGKKGGSIQYTITITSGEFNSTYSEEGFTHINFENYSSAHTVAVDELEIETSGSIKYLAIDDITYETFSDCNPNAAPTSSSVSKSVSRDETNTIAAGHIPYSDDDSDPMDHLRVVTTVSQGTLYVDANNNDTYEAGTDNQITNGETISKADLDAGNLQYVTSGTSDDSFTFDVNDGTDYSSSTYTFDLDVIGKPILSTTSITTFDHASATMGGNITWDGGMSGSSVTERGVVYSTTDPTPEIGETGVTKNTNGSGTGSFSESISGLSESTQYYVQAYAINFAGTSYGGVESFTTAIAGELIDFESGTASYSGWDTKSLTVDHNSTSASFTISASADNVFQASNGKGWAYNGSEGLYFGWNFLETQMGFDIESGKEFDLKGFYISHQGDGGSNPTDYTLSTDKGSITINPPLDGSGTLTYIDVAGHGNAAYFQDISSFTLQAPGSGAYFEIDDILLGNVEAIPNNSDGSLTASGSVSEPVGLSSTIDASGEAIDIFDFTLSDGGGGDGLSMDVSEIQLNVSGTSTDATRNKITWRLNGNDASNVTGTYDAGTDRITFSGLSISVADGASETYTVNAYFNDNTGLAEDQTIILSVDGDTDLIVGGSGTQMGATTAVNNGTGSTVDITATELAFTTQPAGSVSGSALTTQPVVVTQDAFGNTDVDFSETITLTETSAGTLSNNTLSATNGAATFTNLTYTATADQESFTLTANDQDGVGSDLPTTDANAVASNVVATKLLFNTQPDPTSFNAGERVTFTTVPVVAAVDANDVVDTGYNTDIVLAEVNGAGSAILSGTGDTDGNASTVSISPASGVSTFSGLELQYTLNDPAVDENFNFQATSGGLSSVNSTQLTAIGNQPPAITSSNSAGVNENETSVMTVTATDADGDTPEFSISGGVDAAFFSINASSGALTFDAAPDFENPADNGTDNVYNLDVTASDGNGGTDVQSITVTVTDLNDESPVFSSSNTIDVDENTTAVLTVTATDADAGSSVTYSIVGGNDQSKFNINTSTGELTFASAPDFESATDANGDNDYLVTVRASDGTNSTDQAITVSVKDVNDNAPVITSSSTANVDENNTAVMTVTATDADEISSVTYSITGAVDQGLFSINNTSGALTFDSAPDSENPTDSDTNNEYLVEVTATDGTNTDVQTLTVTVNDVNDIDPVVTGSQNFNIDENSANTTSVGTVVATDGDVTPTTFQNWAITGGNTGSAFAINGATGEITVSTSSAIDRESTASFTLQVTVLDGTNTSAAENVTIDINDLNDVTPVITASQSFNIDENSANATSVGTVAATDGDVTATTFQSWTITNGNTDGAFAINSSTGEITVANTVALDLETTASFTLEITVSDGANTSAAESVVIDLNDVNDNDPVFQNTPYSTMVSEDASVGTSVFTVEATDADAGTNGQIQYSITNGNTNGDYTIDANTGEITTANTLDRNTTPTYALEVTATDQGTGNLTATATVSITVNDVNDNAPVIQNEPYTASLDEDENIGETVATISATDADEGINAEIEYSITNGNSESKFTIDVNTGAITVAQALDYETMQGYTIEVTVSDKGTPMMTDVTNVSITVNDVNDNAPVFQGEPYTASIAEDAGPGTSVSTVSATDDDSGVNGQVSYSITNGNTGNAFQIDNNTGVITTAGVLDRETTASYSLEVTATDAGAPAQSQTSTVTVTIIDINDNAPIFTGTPYSAEASEDASTGTMVLTVNATDADEGTNADVQYSITGGNTNGDFVIDASTGEITVNNTLDRETLDTYSLGITATDQGAGNLNSTATVSIMVTDANDNAPIAEDDAYETDEDTELQIAAAGVLANDKDDDLNTNLTAAVVDQPTHGTLTLNADGSFSYLPDANYNGEDSFTYQANDGNANSNIATVDLTVNAVNDAPTVTTPADEEIEINTSSDAISFSIDDIDSDVNALDVTVTADNTTLLPASGISLTGTGADQQLVLTPATDETGSTQLTLMVSDGDKETSTTFTFTVFPVNVAPTDIALNNNTFIESIGLDEGIGNFTTTDENTDDTHVYDLVAGEGDIDNDLFYIENGELFTDAEYDYEIDSVLSIRVRSTDRWGETFEKAFDLSLIADPALELSIPTAFTPNNDGENDVWEIDNILLHPNPVVKVFNRNGHEVFSSVGYEQEWDGTYNGRALPFGTYYFIINLNDSGSRTYKGTVMIIH